MTPSILTHDEEIDAELLNETILRAASRLETKVVAPDTPNSLVDDTGWNEAPETVELRSREARETTEVSIAEQLITAGAEEAEIEKRAAAATVE